MARSTVLMYIVAVLTGAASLVALHGIASFLSTLGAGAVVNEFPSVFEYLGLFTFSLPLAITFVVPGILATLICKSGTPWVGGLAGLLGGLAVELSRQGGFGPAFSHGVASAIGFFIGGISHGVTNIAGSAAALWWFSVRTPSNQPLHPTPNRSQGSRFVAGERRR
jgi:hypothetical protein